MCTGLCDGGEPLGRGDGWGRWLRPPVHIKYIKKRMIGNLDDSMTQGKKDQQLMRVALSGWKGLLDARLQRLSCL